jgi:hypothetical protein
VFGEADRSHSVQLGVRIVLADFCPLLGRELTLSTGRSRFPLSSDKKITEILEPARLHESTLVPLKSDLSEAKLA